MKKNWRKYLAVFCAVSCMGMMTGCSGDKKDADAVTYDTETQEYLEKLMKSAQSQGYSYESTDAIAEEYAQLVLEQYVETYVAEDRDTLEEAAEEDSDEAAIIKSYLDATEGLGEYVEDSARDMDLTFTDEELSLSGTLEFEKRDVMFSFNIDADTSETTLTFEKDLTIGEILAKAGMNTLLGMGSVFLVLILISAIISCFKYISGSEKKKTEPVVQAKPEPAVVEEETDVTDDLELVAVISAAIAAAEGTSADGFVVRSIKRVNNAKWRKA